MFSKQVFTLGAHYIQAIFPSSIKRKCTNSGWPNLRLCFQENKACFIKSNYYSSGQDSSEYFGSGYNSEEKVKLQKWIEMVKYDGARVPRNISDEDFLEILSKDDQTKRLKYLNFLYLKEVAKFNKLRKKERMKEQKGQLTEERRKRSSKGHIEYGLWKNSMFPKIFPEHLTSLKNHKLLNAMMYNQPLVLDLDYYDYMNGREVSSLSRQLKDSIVQNRNSSEPFNLTMCNIDFDSRKYQRFLKFMPSVAKPDFPMNITCKSYLELFSKEKLIYLTPNATEEMNKFDHEAIYIIGGLVDLQGTCSSVTFAKAKREEIRTLKLPIDRFHISKGQKSLAIHVMVNILLELQKSGDFRKAFKYIPKRLLYTSDESHTQLYARPKNKK